MGVIEIRSRSARLGNLGDVRMVDTRTGAAEAYAAKAEAAGAAGRDAMKLAKGIGDIAKSLGDIGIALRDKKDRDDENEYVRRYQNLFNQKQHGTGAEGESGALHEDLPADTEKWYRDNESWRESMAAQLQDEMRSEGKLSSRALKRAVERLHGYDQQQRMAWLDRKATTDRGRRTFAATENLKTAVMNMASPNPSPETTKEWSRACDELAEAKGMTPEEAAALRRSSALQIVRSGVSAYIANVRDTADSMGEDGAREFDNAARIEKEMDPADALLPPWDVVEDKENGETHNPMREALKGVDLTAIRNAAVKDLRDAKKAWKRDLDARKAEGWREARRAAVATERDFLKKNPVQETPEGQTKRLADAAALYYRLADDKSLSDQDSLSYRKMGDAAKAESANVAAQAKARTDAAKVRAMRETAQIEKHVIAFGRTDPATGKVEEFTPAEIEERARNLYLKGRIDYNAYTDLVSVGRERLDLHGKALLEMVRREVDGIMPGALQYYEDSDHFGAATVVRDGKVKAKPEGESPVRMENGQKILYSQLAEMLDLTFQRMRQDRLTPDKGMELFRSLTRGYVQGYQKRTAQETIDAMRGFIDGRSRTISPGSAADIRRELFPMFPWLQQITR